MKNLLFLSIVILYFKLSVCYAQNDQYTVLKYDDGDANIQLTFMDNGGTNFVTRFTPPSASVYIDKIQFYVPDTSNGASFNLNILTEGSNGPGESIFGPFAGRAKKIGWNEVELSKFNVMVQGDFYVELAYDLVSKLTIGAENREPLSGRTYDKDS